MRAMFFLPLLCLLAAFLGPFAASSSGELDSASNCSSEVCPSQAKLGSLEQLGLRVDNSWTAELDPDPEQERNQPNREAREVRSGHFVRVKPTPLPEPYLVAHNAEVATLLGLRESECSTDAFVKVFSGDVDAVPGFEKSWATPYVLSIYGQEQFPNGAGPLSDGYGDGRAISIAEVLLEAGAVDGGGGSPGRWELQLKGSGPTPFCRGSDGRAVLRSSVREFLVSEAMYHMGIPTTRALSLIASGEEHVMRPWYSEMGDKATGEKHGGDVMNRERCAITTRVAPSFLRVGHFELFGRRARKGDARGRENLEQLVRHALKREYPHLTDPDKSLQEQVLAMASEAAGRFARLAAEWLRVGYTQSNFNGDNCLISGRTVDYGPFGFIEQYDPNWAMWVGSGEHFSFMNQPNAAARNFFMFVKSLVPLLNDAGIKQLQNIWQGYDALSKRALDDVWAKKLGLKGPGLEATDLWKQVESLMQQHPTDYTICWRQLAEIVAALAHKVSFGRASQGDLVDDELVSLLEVAFYEPPSRRVRHRWREWLSLWLSRLRDEGEDFAAIAASMKRTSPKYVPREWMLIEAYKAAQQGNHTVVQMLQSVFRHPYDEQPEIADKFYKRRPSGIEKQGGVGFMS